MFWSICGRFQSWCGMFLSIWGSLQSWCDMFWSIWGRFQSWCGIFRSILGRFAVLVWHVLVHPRQVSVLASQTLVQPKALFTSLAVYDPIIQTLSRCCETVVINYRFFKFSIFHFYEVMKITKLNILAGRNQNKTTSWIHASSFSSLYLLFSHVFCEHGPKSTFAAPWKQHIKLRHSGTKKQVSYAIVGSKSHLEGRHLGMQDARSDPDLDKKYYTYFNIRHLCCFPLYQARAKCGLLTNIED